MKLKNYEIFKQGSTADVILKVGISVLALMAWFGFLFATQHETKLEQSWEPTNASAETAHEMMTRFNKRQARIIVMPIVEASARMTDGACGP